MTIRRRTRHVRIQDGHLRWLAGVAAASCLMLSACSSSGSAPSHGATTGTSSSASTASTGNANGSAPAKIEAALKPATDSDYSAPGPALTGVKALRGKTVWFIALSNQITTVALIEDSLSSALDKVGISLRSCDGKANPSVIAACADDAITNKAAAVVFESVDTALVTQSVAKLTQNKIPVVTDNHPNPNGPGPGTASWAFVAGNPQQALTALADWIAVDSGGKAKVLLNEVTDSKPPIAFVTDGFTPELKQQCPDCRLAINGIQTSNYSLMPSSTSAALINHPDTNYVVSEFDAFVGPTAQGVQTSGRLDKVRGASTGGLLAQLQMLKSGQFIYCDVGTNWAYQGFAIADQTLRLMTGANPVAYTVPLRIFTAQNIGTLSLTSAAQVSGEWYGSTAFKQMFLKLWGTAG